MNDLPRDLPGGLDVDDQPIGRVLSRREVLAIMGAAGAGVAIAAAAPGVLAQSPSTSPATSASPAASMPIPSCIVRPAQTEGPYFVDERLDRSDIRSDPTTGEVQAGAPFALELLVSRLDGAACTAFAGALVDVWHCNAEGAYSDVSDPGFDTTGQEWLRGYQVTDANGLARFATIYPGWYQGRTVHIHFKIRTDPDEASGFDFTSQLYFDDTLSDQVFATDPYAAKGERGTRNENDGIFGDGGDQLTLPVVADGSGGYRATFEIGLQMS
jgi:protocatechuate 3,4-dioxygenase beta subunit